VIRRSVILVLAAAAATVGGAAANPRPSISIGPISAVFDPAGRLTRYSVSRYHLNGRAENVTVSWRLRLQLVDPAGAPDPSQAGAGAAVDIGCTNGGVGTPHPVTTTVEVGRLTPDFVWHHPDAVDSIPPGKYHCDHDDMGPHGHQGLITVVVADKHWECTATYKGTISSTAQSVKNGDASEPKCSKIG